MKESMEPGSSAQVRLDALVRQTIEENGRHFEGKTWAIRPYQEWADMAGVSTKTVTRTFQKAPFDTLRKLVEGRQAALVRIGKPDPNQPTRLAKRMAVIFEAQTGQWVSPKAYGCLHGLVQDFRYGWQVEVFKYAISSEGWAQTKSLSKYKTEDHITPLHKTGGTVKPLPGKFHHHHKYPHLPTLRVFWMCAESAFVAQRLSEGSKTPEGHAFWLDWWQERNTAALLDWEPNWKAVDV